MMSKTTVTIDECERQLILLALAKVAVERPGWEYCCGLLADKLEGRFLFQKFHNLRTDAALPSEAFTRADFSESASPERPRLPDDFGERAPARDQEDNPHPDRSKGNRAGRRGRPVRAWMVTLMGVQSLVPARSPSKATAAVCRQALEAGYRVRYIDARARRAPAFDRWAATARENVGHDPDFVRRYMAGPKQRLKRPAPSHH